MALSKCPTCDSHLFEMVRKEPMGSDSELRFVQCAQCGAVVGTLEYASTTRLILQQNTAIEKIARALKVNVELPKP